MSISLKNLYKQHSKITFNKSTTTEIRKSLVRIPIRCIFSN